MSGVGVMEENGRGKATVLQHCISRYSMGRVRIGTEGWESGGMMRQIKRDRDGGGMAGERETDKAGGAQVNTVLEVARNKNPKKEVPLFMFKRGR